MKKNLLGQSFFKNERFLGPKSLISASCIIVEMSLDIIMGGMYSGKTTELIRRLRRYESIGKKILTLNSKIDIRCGAKEIQTHDKKTHGAVKLDHLSIEAIRPQLDEIDVVAIDEANFFEGEELVAFAKQLVNNYHKQVIVCGLDGDYQQNRFGGILDLIPFCDTLVKLRGLCQVCGTEGAFTKRLSQTDGDLVLVDDSLYECRCREHL